MYLLFGPPATNTQTRPFHSPASTRTDSDVPNTVAPTTSTMSEEENKNELQQTKSDPNLEGPEDTRKIKMTGEGQPGSHSAVFGLTPDGQKHDDTAHGTTTSRPAHSKETAVGGGTVPKDQNESNDTSSNAASGAGVAEQMRDPKVAERADGQGVSSEAGAGDKIGSGIGGPAQGTGEVGGDSDTTSGGNSGSGGGFLDKVKGYVS